MIFRHDNKIRTQLEHQGQFDFAEYDMGAMEVFGAVNEDDESGFEILIPAEWWSQLGEPRLVTLKLDVGHVLEAEREEEKKKGKRMMLKLVEILPSVDGQFYLRGMAKNGEPLWASETYTELENAKKHAESYGVKVEDNHNG